MVNDNFDKQLPKKEIYQLKKVPNFDLLNPSTISIYTVKKCKHFVLKTKYPSKGGFMLMTSDDPKLGFRKGLMFGDFTVEVVWLEAVPPPHPFTHSPKKKIVYL